MTDKEALERVRIWQRCFYKHLLLTATQDDENALAHIERRLADPPAPTEDYREVMASYVPDGWDDLSNKIYADIKAIILTVPKKENK